jgi:Zn-dependent protease with chaperone function
LDREFEATTLKIDWVGLGTANGTMVVNLFAILFIIISFAGSQFAEFEPVEHGLERSIAVVLVAALVPAVALFQTSVKRNSLRRGTAGSLSPAELRRLTVAHGLVWLSASASIIWVLRWQDVVRGSWGIGDFLLLDELLILTPALGAMTVSWFVFYELHAMDRISGREGRKRMDSGRHTDERDQFDLWVRIGQWSKPRIDFVGLRFRVYFVPPFILIGALTLLADLSHRFAGASDWLGHLGIAGCFLMLVVALPFSMLLVWSNEPIGNSELQQRLNALSRVHRIQEWQFRRWNTGYQLANAAVLGMIPRLRLVFLSDALIRSFPTDELEAVVRHEAGHIRRLHAAWKIALLCLPIFVAMVYQPWLSHSMTMPIDFSFRRQNWHFEIAPAWSLFLLGLVILAWSSNRWLNHQLEHDADLYAAESRSSRGSEDDKTRSTGQIEIEQLEAMKMALIRFAAISGENWSRSTFLHPSLKHRIDLLETIANRPRFAIQFRKQFAKARLLIVVVWLAMLGIGLTIH